MHGVLRVCSLLPVLAGGCTCVWVCQGEQHPLDFVHEGLGWLWGMGRGKGVTKG